MIRNSSNIVNMGCMEKESCPTLFLQNLLDWNIEDPKDKPIEKVREIRDEIDQRVKELVSQVSRFTSKLTTTQKLFFAELVGMVVVVTSVQSFLMQKLEEYWE
jgi:hypothetical protein